jgi:hypothetical protein
LFVPTPPAPFSIDLADEASTRIVGWVLLRKDEKIGFATTQMTRVAEDEFDLDNKLHQVEMPFFGGAVKAKIPSFSTKHRVTRDGRLLALETRGKMSMEFSLKGVNFPPIVIEANISGEVKGNQLHARYQMQVEPFVDRLSPEKPLAPIDLPEATILNPMMPVNKIRGLRPGQEWEMSTFNPLSEVANIAGQELIKQLLPQNKNQPDLTNQLLKPDHQSKKIKARVASEPRTIEWRDRAYTCWVIEYTNEDMEARTWVSVEDDLVIRQEVSSAGETLVLQRER